MRATVWLESFFKRLDEIEDKELNKKLTSPEWTRIVERVMNKIGEDLNCGVAGRKPESLQKDESGEYLNIDFMFFDKKDYDEDKRVLPRIVVEHENDWRTEKIKYSLWKILCIRSPIRVLICYQPDANKVELLRQYLEDVIWQGNLLKGDYSDLLVIIADESMESKDLEWYEYYKVFEWRNDALVASKILVR